MWVDKGRKFYNKDIKTLDDLYSTENEEKSCVTERLLSNRKHTRQLCYRFDCITSQQQQVCTPALQHVCLYDFSATASTHVSFAAGLIV